MRALLLLPVVAGVQVLETHQALHNHVDYEGMKTTLKELAAKRTGDDKIDSGIVEAVRGILAGVEGTLMGALGDDLKKQQEAFDGAIAAIEACDTDRNSWFTNSYPQLAADEQAAKNAHNLCRSQEVSICGNRNAKCKEQDNRVDAVNKVMCTYPSFANGDSSSVNKFMNCFSDLICQSYETYVAGRNECRGLCAQLANKTSECEQAQKHSEQSFCVTQQQVDKTCGTYRSERNITETAYYKVLETTRQVENLLQTQRSALECLQCYGRAILDHNRTLDHCDTPPECKKLENCPKITYKNPPPFIRCTHCSEMTPCGDGYREDQYNNNTTAGNWLAGVIQRKPDKCVPLVDECTACNVPQKGSGDSECDVISSGAIVPAEQMEEP